MESMSQNSVQVPGRAAFAWETPVRSQTAGANHHYRKFIILSQGRTGSSHLVSLLGSHPGILSFDEVFHPQYVRFDYPGFPGEKQPGLLRFRDGQLDEFMDQLVWPAYPPAVQAAGFKLLYLHLLSAKPLLHHLLAQTGVCFIHLKRRNLFRCLVSMKQALLTKEWSLLGQGHTAARVQFSLNAQECRNFFHLTRKFERYGDEVVRGQAALEVSYEDLLTRPDGTLTAILDFIGADPIPLASKYLRQNVYRLSETVINYEALKHHFKGSEWAGFFDE
jgi:LPS sulfotransferase NodH